MSQLAMLSSGELGLVGGSERSRLEAHIGEGVGVLVSSRVIDVMNRREPAPDQAGPGWSSYVDDEPPTGSTTA